MPGPEEPPVKVQRAGETYFIRTLSRRTPSPPNSTFKNSHWEFLLWLSGIKNPNSVHEDVGSLPGLAQWVKDPVLP